MKGNLNTILLAITLSVLTWLGWTSFENSRALASLQATSNATVGTLTRLENKIDDAVPRREYDTRLAGVETRLAEISVRLRELDLALARMARQP